MIEKNKIWVFLPAFNEATIIVQVIQDIKSCGYHNIVVIDDGSLDNTSTCAIQQDVAVIRFCINRGVGAAMQAAILFAKRKGLEYLVLMDADGQHLPQDIEHLKNEMEKGKVDIIVGSRFIDKNSSIPRSRRIYNGIANIITTLGKTPVSDSQSGFRFLNKKAIDQLDLDIDRYGVCTEMIWRAHLLGLKLSEVPIQVNYTSYSMSKGQSFWNGVQTGFSLLQNLPFFRTKNKM